MVFNVYDDNWNKMYELAKKAYAELGIDTDAVIEVLMLKDLGNDTWECLSKPARRIKIICLFIEGFFKSARPHFFHFYTYFIKFLTAHGKSRGRFFYTIILYWYFSMTIHLFAS